ncbi:unnamed protein product [Moneuplotes crassus]|uniref:Uncharacterized protein n=1 Tax=Euplotes crassus TaxID=5936 RepID=A0AAD1UA55_EUPCR|nr:unnamed protein product [Moneuplotes crassus]
MEGISKLDFLVKTLDSRERDKHFIEKNRNLIVPNIAANDRYIAKSIKSMSRRVSRRTLTMKSGAKLRKVVNYSNKDGRISSQDYKEQLPEIISSKMDISILKQKLNSPRDIFHNESLKTVSERRLERKNHISKLCKKLRKHQQNETFETSPTTILELKSGSTRTCSKKNSDLPPANPANFAPVGSKLNTSLNRFQLLNEVKLDYSKVKRINFNSYSNAAKFLKNHKEEKDANQLIQSLKVHKRKTSMHEAEKNERRELEQARNRTQAVQIIPFHVKLSPNTTQKNFEIYGQQISPVREKQMQKNQAMLEKLGLMKNITDEEDSQSEDNDKEPKFKGLSDTKKDIDIKKKTHLFPFEISHNDHFPEDKKVIPLRPMKTSGFFGSQKLFEAAKNGYHLKVQDNNYQSLKNAIHDTKIIEELKNTRLDPGNILFSNFQ